MSDGRSREHRTLRFALLVAGGLIALAGMASRRLLPAASNRAATVAVGVNPQPVHLVRPPTAPLTRLALLGRALFFDSTLSGSRHLSCASCHSPDHAYGPPASAIFLHGGVSGRVAGTRTVPSLRYIDRAPAFSVGRDAGDLDAPAVSTSTSAVMTPRGGLFWDGRASTLQTQALSPLLNPAEMANPSASSVAMRIRAAYGARFAKLLGGETIATNDMLVAEAMYAIARFEIEDHSFHPYDSKYDAYLEGRAALSPAEARGLALFDAPAKGNCAACHLDRPTADGRPPALSDFEYEALGVPRNRAIATARRYDLGLCGPVRSDLATQRTFCGMFRTPSLRNVAVRGAFFHNGAARTLDDVLRFYAFRDTRPDLVYPRDASGAPARFDDLPVQYWKNVDVTDPPFNRKPGDPPGLSATEMHDIIAFLNTLTDSHVSYLTLTHP